MAQYNGNNNNNNNGGGQTVLRSCNLRKYLGQGVPNIRHLNVPHTYETNIPPKTQFNGQLLDGDSVLVKPPVKRITEVKCIYHKNIKKFKTKNISKGSSKHPTFTNIRYRIFII